MKKQIFIFLLCAGTLLSLAGCQEKSVTPDGNKEGQLVEFAAVSGNPATRTAYSGEGTTDTDGNLTWERIDWVIGDKVLIWSDKATSKASSSKAATYSILTVTEAGNESRASIADPSETGLRYAVEGGDHKFWGLYPASATSTTPTPGSVSYSIPTTQTGTKEVAANGNISIKPNMEHAVMLAAIEGAQPKQKVDIRFYPAFTAFELTFKVDEAYKGEDPVLLHHVTLSSSSDLVGTVAATIATGTRKFNATVPEGTPDYAFITEGKEYTVGASTYIASATAKTVTFNLPEAVELEKGKTLTLTIVTLPQNVNDLTIGMAMGQNGEDVRTGTLKIGTGENKKNLAFAACQKHNIRGVLVKPNDWEFSMLTFLFENPWEKVEFDPVHSEDYPQSTQFEVTGAAVNVRNFHNPNYNEEDGEIAKYKGYRQCWALPVEGEDYDGTTNVTFKVMLPKGGTWKVEPQGDLSSYVITPALTDGALSGDIGNDGTTRVSFSITPVADSLGKSAKALWFKTSVTNAAGTTYSLDSETQLFDARGYHYFLLNIPLDKDNDTDLAKIDALINPSN